MQQESFENWTGDEMQTCNDLVYKLMLSNTTEVHVLFKIDFKKDLGETKVNLHWPINGIKGKLAPGENATVALLAKIHPREEMQASGKFELEKLKVNLTWKPNLEKIAVIKDAVAQDGMLAASVGNDQWSNQDDNFNIPLGVAAPDVNSFVNIDQSGSAEKNCSACTMLNPVTATIC